MSFQIKSDGRFVRKYPPLLSGAKLGRLTLLESFHLKGKANWKCLCECGLECVVREDHIQRGETSSCGCLHSELASERTTIHGESNTSLEWQAWVHMRERCLNPNTPGFSRYGGRGISVCDEWSTYAVFLKDMGRKPSPAHSIERIDNDGNYEPSNCRWATKKEQANNRRTNRFIEHDGKRFTLAQWQDHTGISQFTLLKRLKDGWSESEALTIPVRCSKSKKQLVKA
jgi:hypothetical protein